MLNGLGANDLFVADHGYPSRRTFLDIEQQGAAYLIRLPCGKAGVFSDVRACALNEDQWDSEIELPEDRQATIEPTLRLRLLKYRLTSGARVYD